MTQRTCFEEPVDLETAMVVAKLGVPFGEMN
jgi:hypothetical protein